MPMHNTTDPKFRPSGDCWLKNQNKFKSRLDFSVSAYFDTSAYLKIFLQKFLLKGKFAPGNGPCRIRISESGLSISLKL